MKLFRNRDFRNELLIFSGLTLLAAVGGFFVSPVCGGLLLLLGAAFTALWCVFYAKREKKLAAFSQCIDRVLHGQDSVLISECEEGELSILSSEIGKMTLRLREQTDLLTRDKLRLTDAIADIFHQVRTPMTAMNLLVSLLSEPELSYSRRLALTRELHGQLERTDFLVEALLKMSKIDAGTAKFAEEPVAVSELVSRAVEPFRIRMELRGQVFSADCGSTRFRGDLLWTTEAIGNLLKNCMEHTPEGGSITVTAQENALYTQISIRDTGTGFDPEDVPHLFERFYRGKNAGTGSVGIGLALTRMIVSAQNGSVTAQNAPDGGAQFTVRFYKTIV